ncbi:MAG: cobalamin-binding protein [Actinomycetia bacterium]|nr:cobalamin-binding protein [Actinomycetes bacterium]MCP4960449.1 cobalamin-binding protein [Actinomycetes bacterium]
MSVEDIFDAVLDYEDEEIAALVRSELENGTPVDTILDTGLIQAMTHIGQEFSEGTIFVPEMLMAAETMKAGLDVLRPLLTDGSSQARGLVVIGSVKGDIHDIGKNLFGMMLEGSGFEVVDLGVNVGADDFLSAIDTHRADVVGLSAMLTTTMTNMASTVGSIRESGTGVHVMVGGAPVTQEFASDIGADGFGKDGPTGAATAMALLGR